MGFTQPTYYKKWDEESIINRNEDIAKRICEATISPSERIVPFEIQEFSEEFVPGLYPISDTTTPMSSANIVEIIFDDTSYKVNSWRGFLNKICEIVYNLDSEKFIQVVKDNLIHKSTSRRNKNGKDPIISFEDNLLHSPLEIPNTGIYVEGCVNSDVARVYAKQLLDILELTPFCQIQVENPEK